VCGSVLQCVSVRIGLPIRSTNVLWGVLQCVAVCCSVLQCVSDRTGLSDLPDDQSTSFEVCCSMLQRVAGRTGLPIRSTKFL